MDTKTEDEIKCPICVTIFSGKIFQCREGHILCESCLKKIHEVAGRGNTPPKCPSCNGRFDNDSVSRARVLENQLDRITIDCSYKKNGCSVKLTRAEITKHESSCVYIQGLGICWMFGNTSCSFRLSTGTAGSVIEHIKASHSSTKFPHHQFSFNLYLKKAWEAVSASSNANTRFANIVEVPHSPHHVAIIGAITKDCVSFYSVDLSLCLLASRKPRVTYNISKNTDILMSWTIPLVCGIESWKFLSDGSSQKPIAICIQSLLQHCDNNGILVMNVLVEQDQAQSFVPQSRPPQFRSMLSPFVASAPRMVPVTPSFIPVAPQFVAPAARPFVAPPYVSVSSPIPATSMALCPAPRPLAHCLQMPQSTTESQNQSTNH